MGDHKPISTNTPGRSYSFTLDAIPEKFAEAQEQVHVFLEPVHCSMRTLLGLDMVVEEVFINIASYAYSDGIGTVKIDLSLNETGDMLTLTFRDTGTPYDPLAKDAPNLSAPAEQRPIGGLGIFLAKQYMEEMNYRYENGSNILTMIKNLR